MYPQQIKSIIMKKVLLFVSLLTLGSSFAQDCTKIFISEYVEGLGNNKALEIYNPTNAPIDLSEYFLARYNNGTTAATVQNAVQLIGTVPAHGTFVAVIDRNAGNATASDPAAWDELQALADGFFCSSYDVSNAMNFNGDDAVLLMKGSIAGFALNVELSTIPNTEVIDVIGKVGERPNGGWSTAAPYDGSAGAGVAITKDHSLIRKASILKGNTDAIPAEFNALVEWDSLPPLVFRFDANGDTIKSAAGAPVRFGNWDSLGSHDCNCNSLSTSVVEAVQMDVYPNPTSNGTFNVISSENIKSITVYNTLGQVVKKTRPNTNNANVQIGNSPGLFIVQIETAAGTATKRLIVKN